MSSAFCSIEEAFAGPKSKSSHKKSSSSSSRSVGKEHFVPEAISGSPDSEKTVPEPMGPPSSAMSGKVGAVALNDFFPLPGESAQTDEWAKAFTLEPSNMPPMLRPDGSAPVAGQSTLWRKVPVPAATATVAATPLTYASPSGPTSDIQSRLDALSKQLDSLTTVTPMQSTAELFLFVAIGLLFLLAIDTLLRFATTIALSKKGGQSGGGRGLSRRWRFW